MNVQNAAGTAVHELNINGAGGGVLFLNNSAGARQIQLHTAGDSYVNGNVGIKDTTPGSTFEVGGSFASLHTVSSATSLTMGDSSIYVFTGSSAATWTLPAVSTTVNRVYWIKHRGSSSASLTIQRSGTDQLYDTGVVTSITINAGAGKMLSNDGTYWLVH